MRRLSVVLALLVCVAVVPATAAGAPLKKPKKLGGVYVTEYYAVPESWFVGEKVQAPGLDSTHRVDWLYGAKGVSMEGHGIGLDGKTYHMCGGFQLGWVTPDGKPTSAASGFSQGAPFWRAGGYWLSRGQQGHLPPGCRRLGQRRGRQGGPGQGPGVLPRRAAQPEGVRQRRGRPQPHPARLTRLRPVLQAARARRRLVRRRRHRRRDQGPPHRRLRPRARPAVRPGPFAAGPEDQGLPAQEGQDPGAHA